MILKGIAFGATGLAGYSIGKKAQRKKRKSLKIKNLIKE